MSVRRPDKEAELGRLKGFQRAAAHHAFERLFTGEGSSGRFLVADEVGLGKTLIARGIMALAIDHMWDTVERIDMIYICSNASIARQNVRRLGFGALAAVERVTLLPVTAHDLEGSKLNFVAVTPGTSFELSSSLGIAKERRLLYHMMQALWPVQGTGPMNFLQGTSRNRDWWRESLKLFLDRNTISSELQARFHRTLEEADCEERASGECGLRARWEEACKSFQHYRRKWPRELRRTRRYLIAELRSLLAKSCIGALEPDLIILDEFQRFKHLLEPREGDEAAELARMLFEWQDESTDAQARVLLLSATPYKMYTLAQEAEEDDHYADFLRTVAFLQGDERQTQAFEQLLIGYRRELFQLAEGAAEGVRTICRSIEKELRLVMSRTERTLASGKRDGMLRTVPPRGLQLSPRDLVDFVRVKRVGREIGNGQVLNYWKSAPYLLSFLEGYQLDRNLEQAVDAPATGEMLGGLLDAARASFVDPADIERYKVVDPANARLRSLLTDMVDTELWRCLWLPPSNASYQPCGVYESTVGMTKRLVFSAWGVVPRVISALVSYEVERLAFTGEDRQVQNTPEARERRRPLLRFSRSDGRLAGMPVLGLIYPSSRLAELGDLREREGALLTRDEAIGRVQERIEEALQRLPAYAASAGAEDESWYWAAPILLDLQGKGSEQALDWWEDCGLASSWGNETESAADGGSDGEGGWASHFAEARALVRGDLELGRPPDDLASLLARLAIAGPGVAALRALWRVLPGADLFQPELRLAAARIGWGFRSLFNRPEATAIIRGPERKVPMWRMALDYAVDGCLGDVLDEYVHVLRELEGLFSASIAEAADGIAAAVLEATTLRTTQTTYRVLEEEEGSPVFQRRRFRGHYALRFGAEKTEEDAQAQRVDQVRTAFNSPFWPFVLASTSVGQEGLDFHAYCHAVVHWNLPANPVDLEQREGRVHRFKGHAVRKNAALAHGAEERQFPSDRDPWAALFERARAETRDDRGGLLPYWVYECEDGFQVERYVPALPYSRDQLRYEALQRSLAVYRMVFGQPRQDDLLAFLMKQVPDEVLKPLLDELRIDLSPLRQARG